MPMQIRGRWCQCHSTHEDIKTQSQRVHRETVLCFYGWQREDTSQAKVRWETVLSGTTRGPGRHSWFWEKGGSFSFRCVAWGCLEPLERDVYCLAAAPCCKCTVSSTCCCCCWASLLHQDLPELAREIMSVRPKYICTVHCSPSQESPTQS